MRESLFFLRFAVRNLLRRPARSFMILLLVVITMVCLLFIQGVYGGMVQAIIDNAIQKDCGYIILENTKFREEQDLNATMDAKTSLDLVTRSIGETPSIRRILCKGLVQTALVSRGVEITGIDLSIDAYNKGLMESLTEGSFLSETDLKGALLGQSLAEDLGVKIGSKVIIRTQDSSGELTATALRVRGLLNASNPKIDKMRVFMNLRRAQKFLLTPGQITQIGLFPRNLDDLDQMVQSLRERFPEEVRIDTWRDFYPAFAIGEEMMDIVNLVLISIAFVAVGLGIFDSILISMLERMREFGILLALGTPDGRIRNLILTEGIILGFLGYCVGAFLGTILLLYFHHHPIDLTIFGSGPQTFGLIPSVPADIQVEYYLYSAIVLCLAIFVSCAVPVWILKRLKPVQSLRFT